MENKNYQLDFLLENINIQNNLLILAKKYGVKEQYFWVYLVFIQKYLKFQSRKNI